VDTFFYVWLAFVQPESNPGGPWPISETPLLDFNCRGLKGLPTVNNKKIKKNKIKNTNGRSNKMGEELRFIFIFYYWKKSSSLIFAQLDYHLFF
jgi:hypothetical protein